jgi:hypothetical protein
VQPLLRVQRVTIVRTSQFCLEIMMPYTYMPIKVQCYCCCERDIGKKYVKWCFFNTIYGFKLFTIFGAKSGNFGHPLSAQVKTKRPSVPFARLLSKNRGKVATLLLILHRVKFSSNNLRIVSLLMWPLHFPQGRQAPSTAPPPCP